MGKKAAKTTKTAAQKAAIKKPTTKQSAAKKRPPPVEEPCQRAEELARAEVRSGTHVLAAPRPGSAPNGLA